MLKRIPKTSLRTCLFHSGPWVFTEWFSFSSHPRSLGSACSSFPFPTASLCHCLSLGLPLPAHLFSWRCFPKMELFCSCHGRSLSPWLSASSRLVLCILGDSPPDVCGRLCWLPSLSSLESSIGCFHQLPFQVTDFLRELEASRSGQGLANGKAYVVGTKHLG